MNQNNHSDKENFCSCRKHFNLCCNTNRRHTFLVTQTFIKMKGGIKNDRRTNRTE